MPGTVHLVGAGPGDAELLTLRAVRRLQAADAVVYDRLVAPEILELVPSGARMVPVGKAPRCHTVPQERINEILHELAREGLDVVRLKGGEPMIFGRASEEAAYLTDRGIAVTYVPGITAAQGMAAATGVPLTHRGLATGVRYVTGHRARDQRLDLDWRSLASEDTTLVVYMGVANIAEIALRLMAEGMPGRLPVLAVSNATTPRETRLLSRLDRIGRDIAQSPMPSPVLFVIGHVVSLYREGRLQDAAPEPLLAEVMAGE